MQYTYSNFLSLHPLFARSLDNSFIRPHFIHISFINPTPSLRCQTLLLLSNMNFKQIIQLPTKLSSCQPTCNIKCPTENNRALSVDFHQRVDQILTTCSDIRRRKMTHRVKANHLNTHKKRRNAKDMR